MRRATLLLVTLLVAASSLCAGAAELILPDGRTVSLEVVTADGSGWVCLDKLAKAIGGSAGRDPLSRYPVWTLGKHRVVFSTATAMTSVDGRLLDTVKAAREKDGCIWVPESFLTVGLPMVVDGPVRAKEVPGVPVPPPVAPPVPTAVPPVPATAPGASPAAPEGASVSLETTVAADRIKVSFCGTGAAQAQVRREGDVLLVSFALGRVGGPTRELGSGIASRLEVGAEGRTARILLGAGFREYATSAQKSPDCFTVTLDGTGQIVPSPGAAPAGSAGPEGQRPTKAPGQFVVVLDPGHGGSDTGALAPGGLAEKDLALTLAKRIASALEKAGMRVVLTREGDTFVPLPQRTAVANYNRADVLLSIHLNASPAPSAKGAETFFMSREATDLWSRQLAEKENSAGAGAGGVDTLSLVLWNLAQTQSIVESSALAEAIQGRLNGLLGTKERGVRQAPFVVLEGAEMPAVLVEVAFLTNPGEAKQLQEAPFQDQVAAALSASVSDFRARNDAPPPPSP